VAGEATCPGNKPADVGHDSKAVGYKVSEAGVFEYRQQQVRRARSLIAACRSIQGQRQRIGAQPAMGRRSHSQKVVHLANPLVISGGAMQ